MLKKFSLAAAMIGMLVLLTGCFEIEQPITSESEGIWNSYFVYPLSWLIIKLAEMFNGSFGWSIVAVTVILRTVMLPLMIKQTRSAKAMQQIQPEIKKLQEKYSAKDQKTQQKLQQEMMALWQERGVNPLAGCLPILVQMPILLGLYHAIMRTDIGEGSFLWFALDQPDYILPFIAGVTTYIQQKMMMVQDNPQMKVLLVVMPIMIAVFAFFFPAALTLYWVVGNIYMIAQTYFITGPNAGNKKEVTANSGGKKK
ncbi:OxaA precursor [Alkalihalobacillus alcalophilus ATCC 27647 = CGMCC 1.3604]|uniref:Membrane protein insertase YidC n=1 Tax=Alkalihalobacillus alcalophilus ATCC 27647 = CGMCC 1.3604 TaxID=1218173 RepID=A0A094XBZ4_ALKAL|nr:YidC family membrane integrase SpoIIIJ [Alkalihalobacillus alcalophilus]KGA96305.1 OxaA-like protein precursor [Alkalihalobacillus alcalophilus ATCC 27647 = CGMCC 1.3604]MED1560353.1 YidC family membrane integrase SpoIIIJ [Alkalihalobacillus alcalophilus]THG89961.1 OxaA precursor [Alkalihalobacillus alcalophilus ATCC 27647 = CGMCC 1.3604]